MTARAKAVLKSGRTPAEEFEHKVRGIYAFLVDLNYLFPRIAMLIFLGVCMAMLGYAWHVYDRSKNPRLLTGEELAQGIQAFNAIRTADTVAEDFSKSGVRTKAFAEAAIHLAHFQGTARTHEANRAALVMAYYLDECRKIPQADVDLAHARYKANKHELRTMNMTAVNYDDLEIIQTAVPYIQAQAERSDAERVLRACRNEALSYVFPNQQPPIDVCIYSHDAPKVDRR